MIENAQSLDTAETIEISVASGNTESYLWAFPGSPVRISLRLDVVTRIREQLAQSFGPDSQHKTESGGLLLGTAQSGLTEISGFTPFFSARHDRHFVISDDERPRLRRAIDQWKDAESKLSVVGFYRSNLRDGLRLADEDLTIINEYFRHPSNVFLVVGPGDDGVPSAGFFFWNSGVVFGDMTFMPFPFDELQLAQFNSSVPAVELNDDEAGRASESSNSPHLAAPETRVDHRGSRVKLVITTISAVTLLGLGALSRFPIVFRFPASGPKPSQAQVQVNLMSLSAGLSGNDVLISWDVNSAAISDAKDGVLTIQDGQIRRVLPLTRSMLNARSTVYPAAGETVQVELEVISAAGKSTRETVLALLNRSDQNSARKVASISSKEVKVPPSLHEEIVSNQRVEQSPIPAHSVPTHLTESAKAAEAVHAPIPAPIAAPITTASLPAVTKNVPALVEPPPALHASSQEALQAQATGRKLELPGPTMPQAPPTFPRTQERASPAAQVSVPQTRRELTDVTQPAKVVQQTRPEVPLSVRGLISREIEIEVRLRVDETGKVVRVDTPPQKGVGVFLGNSAAIAARLWRFEPARQSGRPVPSEVVVQFRFGPEKSR